MIIVIKANLLSISNQPTSVMSHPFKIHLRLTVSLCHYCQNLHPGTMFSLWMAAATSFYLLFAFQHPRKSLKNVSSIISLPC